MDGRRTDSLLQHIFYKSTTPLGTVMVHGSSQHLPVHTYFIHSIFVIGCSPLHRFTSLSPPSTHNFPLNTSPFHLLSYILYIPCRFQPDTVHSGTTATRVISIIALPTYKCYCIMSPPSPSVLLLAGAGRRAAFPRQKFRNVWSSAIRHMPHLS